MKIGFMALAVALVLSASGAQMRGEGLSAELRSELKRYGMTCGKCSRNTGGYDVTVRWVMCKPRVTSQKLPVLVFLPGLGELGPDLANLFRNHGIFDLVTSPEFQKRHPCVFVALQTEAGVERHCLSAGRAAPSLAAMSAALEDALSRLGSTKIDRERIYLTGLSAGGGACCSMICAYPGRFAAAIPIAGVVHPRLLSKTEPENIWMMFNSGELERAKKYIDFDALTREMSERGGDFRVGELTGEGHNAWDGTWREAVAWDWMFSKRAKPQAANATQARASSRSLAAGPAPRTGWKCTASAKAESSTSLPRFGADGLNGTMYRSGASARKGDWWQVEFSSPRSGAMKILTGDESGKGAVRRGSVMVSSDGQRWTKAVALRDGTASFRVDRPIKFVRLRVEANQAEPFAVREVELR